MNPNQQVAMLAAILLAGQVRSLPSKGISEAITELKLSVAIAVAVARMIIKETEHT